MLLVAVDIGNSCTKFGLSHAPDTTSDRSTEFAHLHRIGNELSFAAEDFSWLPAETSSLWVVCSVNPPRAAELQAWLQANRPLDRFHLIEPSDMDLPLAIETSATLGRDRMLGAWQARRLCGPVRLVVIDAGTAVTIDSIDANGTFLGGIICPGAETMLATLARQTSVLPDLSKLGIEQAISGSAASADPPRSNPAEMSELPFIGTSTRQAILLGVYQSQLCLLKNAAASLQKASTTPLQVVVTGGGIVELRPWLPSDWRFEPNLLLEGAYAIGQNRILNF